MMQEVQSFGQWVRDRRKQRQLTQKELGRLVGYAEITIRQIEHDKYHLTRFVVDSAVNCLASEQDDREAIARFALKQLAASNDAELSIGTRPSLTPFFGRETELSAIHSLLHNPDCRCISIVGVGGIGKTRLAVRAVDNYIAETGATAWFLNLANVTSAALLPTAMAETLDIALTPFASPFEQLLLAIRSKDMLLVFDNFEHLLPDGIELLMTILERAPRIKIVVTSRERLRISAEWCIPLHGLDTSAQPFKSEAARLFISTAQRINNKFDASEVSAIQEICRVVQGIPLAIEMAASWTEIYSCGEILSGISKEVLDLASRQRDIDPRHRTLQAVFDTTWTLLSPDEQTTLKKLAVFRGGFTLDAARQVIGITLANVAFLQDKMLIQAQPNGRLIMHPVIHQFALQKLAANDDELLQARLSHAGYFVDVMRHSLPRLRFHYSRQEITRLSPDIENLQTAWETILQQGRADWFFDVWECLYLFYNITARFHYGEAAFHLASITFRSPADPKTEALIRAFCQGQHAEFLFRQGRIPEACALQYAPEIQIVRDDQDHHLLHWVLSTDSFLYHAIGNAAASKASAQQVLDIALADDDQYFAAAAYFLLGRSALLLKEYEEAYHYLSEVVRICRTYGLNWALSFGLIELGTVTEIDHKLVEALGYYERGLASAASFEDLWSYHLAQISLGRVQLALGQVEKAIDSQLASLRAMIQNPYIGLQIDNFVEIGQILIHKGDSQLAAALLEVCASHPECFQPTRDRAVQYLADLKARLPELSMSTAHNLLPTSKAEIAMLLAECLSPDWNP